MVFAYDFSKLYFTYALDRFFFFGGGGTYTFILIKESQNKYWDGTEDIKFNLILV